MLLLVFAILINFAEAKPPLRDVEGLRPPKEYTLMFEERVKKLSNAEIIYLDYELLREDFKGLRTLSKKEIREIVKNCVDYISLAQANTTIVNTPISTTNNIITAYRPLAYGRALIFKCLDGLIDVKGSGRRSIPEDASHKNGLFAASESLREIVFEKLLALILKKIGYQAGTVRNYGAISFGFDINDSQGRELAGGVLRQVYERDRADGRASDAIGQYIEKQLRLFGFTSNYENVTKYSQTATLDRHNVQVTKHGAMFDMGSILNIPENLNSPYITIDPTRRFPFAEWGHSSAQFEKMFPYTDKVREWGRQVVGRWANGELTLDQIEDEVNKWVNCAAVLL